MEMLVELLEEELVLELDLHKLHHYKSVDLYNSLKSVQYQNYNNIGYLCIEVEQIIHRRYLDLLKVYNKVKSRYQNKEHRNQNQLNMMMVMKLEKEQELRSVMVKQLVTPLERKLALDHYLHSDRMLKEDYSMDF